ncbi:hypothetical protein E2K98_03955 [Bacillus salipaludis]|uniref:WXG100 family type VII secretion target n=1 Tax=Bacillus salipaludis TaxID=2547811 RepID=A0A4R5VXC4_9BACI|nr:hypothetical protein [Bacillus salipaludis]MDQ6595108.1 hypothetical protein [Bacillus salipaludis]TDK64030.1 hypothetical protein E2K98_03955 [Bacillus salipaludis]
MSRIKIQPDFVKSTGAGLAPDSSKLLDMKDGLSTLMFSINYKITGRNNLLSRMDGAVKEISNLERQVKALEQFIDHSAEQYWRVERGLTEKSFDAISTKKGKPTFLAIINFLNSFNSNLSKSDAALIATQLLSVATTGALSRKLKINYINGKPSFLQKIKGDYKFTVKADPSWTSRGGYSSKVARMIYDFSKSNPSNPLVKQLHKFVASYSSPSALLKHVAGFPKNVNSMLKGKTLSSTFKNRITIGTKEVAEEVLKARGLYGAAKKIPVVGWGISIGANLSELWSDDNVGKNTGEKLGRASAGILADFGAITGGAQLGAMIGSVGGPVGIIVGGAVGGLVGGVGSMVFENQIKDVGEKIGGAAESGGRYLGSKISSGFKSVKSWFN